MSASYLPDYLLSEVSACPKAQGIHVIYLCLKSFGISWENFVAPGAGLRARRIASGPASSQLKLTSTLSMSDAAILSVLVEQQYPPRRWFCHQRPRTPNTCSVDRNQGPLQRTFKCEFFRSQVIFLIDVPLPMANPRKGPKTETPEITGQARRCLCRLLRG
jgi:hypothetical protein